MTKPDRRQWKRLVLPSELLDLLTIIAKSKGVSEDELHLFVYQLLKESCPEDVAKLGHFLNTTWLDDE